MSAVKFEQRLYKAEVSGFHSDFPAFHLTQFAIAIWCHDPNNKAPPKTRLDEDVGMLTSLNRL